MLKKTFNSIFNSNLFSKYSFKNLLFFLKKLVIAQGYSETIHNIVLHNSCFSYIYKYVNITKIE